MSSKFGDMVIKNGTYVNKNGETKNRYVNIGALMESEKGFFALLDPTINLAGFDRNGSSVMVSVFKRDNSNSDGKPEKIEDESGFHTGF